MEPSADKKKKIPAIDEKYFFILAFIAGAFFMYMILSYSGLLVTGKYCILISDSLEIYVPNIREMCRNILNGDNIYYSFTHSLGMNMALSLAFYGAFNPLNLLYLIFFRVDPNIITAALVVIKAGLAAMTFQIFSRKALKISDYRSVIFAVFYALCAFQVSFNIVNFIWMDAVYMLPLVILSVYYLAEKGEWRLLCVCFTYLFVTQFYMGYVVGIIGALFFIGSIWLLKRKTKTYKYILGFLAASVIAVMTAAVVWLPALYFLMHHPTPDATAFSGIHVNPLDIYNQLFFSNTIGYKGFLPNLYCGIPVLIYAPVYFIFVRNEKKEKILYAIMLVFLALTFTVNPLYLFMHAFDAPDGWMFRHAWMFSFFMCAVALKGAARTQKTGKKYFAILVTVNAVIYIAELFWLKYRFAQGETVNGWIYLAVNIGLMTVWFFLFEKCRDSFKGGLSTMVIACLLLAGVECIAGGFLSYIKNPDEHPRLEDFYYYPYSGELKNLKDYTASDPSFYRVNYPGSITCNSDTDGGFFGISDFETAENENVRRALRKLGVATSPRVVYPDGMTPVTDMLLGVKYNMYANEKSILETERPVRTDKNGECLSLGFMTNAKVMDVVPGNNVFANNNNLLSAMTDGENGNVFTLMGEDEIEIDSHGISVEHNDDGSYTLSSEGEELNTVDFIANPEGGPVDDAYIYFENTESVSKYGSMIIGGETENLTDYGGTLSVSYIKKFENDDGKQKVTIYARGTKKQIVRDIYAAVLDREKLTGVYNELSDGQMEITEWSNGYIKGRVTSEKGKTFLFTTIPYDEGWEIKVDGVKSNGKAVWDGAFIGIDIPEEGEHEIEMSYHVGWLKEGLLISVFGLAAFGGYGLFCLAGHRKKPENVKTD